MDQHLNTSIITKIQQKKYMNNEFKLVYIGSLVKNNRSLVTTIKNALSTILKLVYRFSWCSRGFKSQLSVHMKDYFMRNIEDLRLKREFTRLDEDDNSRFHLIYTEVQEKALILECSSKTRNEFHSIVQRKCIVYEKANWASRELPFINPNLARFERELNKTYASLSRDERDRRRKNINPYEKVKRTFSTRNANKLANLDQIFDYKLTALDDDIERCTSSPVFYIAEIGCGLGTGSYTEYVTRRNKFFNCKSFGLSTDSSYLFAPGRIRYAWPFFLDMYHREGSMDITDSAVRDGFIEFIMKGTNKEKVDLCVADAVGWHPVKPYHEFFYMKKLVAQFLVSLVVLKRGGKLVATCFEMNTVMSAGLFYLLYFCFDRVSIHKPNSTRPHSPERFLVCYGYIPTCGKYVVEYLHNILMKWDKDERKEVTECVPFAVISSDLNFRNYLLLRNECITKKQIEFMEHLVYDRVIVEPPNNALREFNRILNLPIADQYRSFSHTKSPEEFFRYIRNSYIPESRSKASYAIMLTSTTNPAIVCSVETGTFILHDGEWIRMENECLPPFTILLVEYTSIRTPMDGYSECVTCLRIIDCAILHGLSFSRYPLLGRLMGCAKFLNVITPTYGSFLYNGAMRRSIKPIRMTSAKVYENKHVACSRLRTYSFGSPSGDYVTENGSTTLCNYVAELRLNGSFWDIYDSFMRGKSVVCTTYQLRQRSRMY